MKSRIKEDDESVPFIYNGYYYITRFKTGKDYPIYSKKGKPSAKEEIMLDCNELAKGKKYFKLSGLSVMIINWLRMHRFSGKKNLYFGDKKPNNGRNLKR
jgi:oligopeptidase B